MHDCSKLSSVTFEIVGNSTLIKLLAAAGDEEIRPERQAEEPIGAKVQPAHLLVAADPRGEARRGARAEEIAVLEVGGKRHPLAPLLGGDDVIVEGEAVAEAR